MQTLTPKKSLQAKTCPSSDQKVEPVKTQAPKWLVPKSIKFDPDKLKKAKRKKKLKYLAEKCREQLDLLIQE